MDLRDVVYIIDGSLYLEELPKPTPEGHRFRATLFDNIHDPCMLQGEGLEPEPDSRWRYATATATGFYRNDALAELACRIKGNVLGHDFPIQTKTFTEWVRIPPTLIVGDISGLLNRRRPFSIVREPEPTA